MKMITLFYSPFNGNFARNKERILNYLDIKKIEDQPVAEALVQYPGPLTTERVTKIKAGEGKYYGLAFFLYCLMKYGTEEEKGALCFALTLPMAADALLYYGAELWGDKDSPHPSIQPFRLIAQDYGIITVQLAYEPHH